MSLKTALEGFRSTLKKLDNDINNLEDEVHNLEESLDMHLNGVKGSNVDALKAVERAMNTPAKAPDKQWES